MVDLGCVQMQNIQWHLLLIINNDIFANREATISNEEYDEILENNPGMAESLFIMILDDPSKGWTFGEDYILLVGVISTTQKVIGLMVMSIF